MNKGTVSMRRLISLVLATLLFIGAIGCGGGPSDEELQALEEVKQAALAAEKKAKDLEEEKGSLTDTLNAKRAELKEVMADKDSVQKKIDEIDKSDDELE